MTSTDYYHARLSALAAENCRLRSALTAAYHALNSSATWVDYDSSGDPRTALGLLLSQIQDILEHQPLPRTPQPNLCHPNQSQSLEQGTTSNPV